MGHTTLPGDRYAPTESSAGRQSLVADRNLLHGSSILGVCRRIGNPNRQVSSPDVPDVSSQIDHDVRAAPSPKRLGACVVHYVSIGDGVQTDRGRCKLAGGWGFTLRRRATSQRRSSAPVTR